MRTNLRLLTFSIACVFVTACGQKNNTLSAGQSQEVKNDILKLADSTAQGISARGPIAWLDYFEDSPDFFMVNDGAVQFPDHKTANSFIRNTLVKVIQKISLKWSGIKVDLLTPEIAVMAAGYHEDITDSSGKTTPYNGYFTALVHKTANGWKFRNLHWSSAPMK